MAVNINPPPQLKVPDVILKDSQWLAYERQRDIILFQLWKRTGGDVDLIDGTAISISDAETIARALSVRPSQLFSLQSQIDGASDRIEANEIDLATRPRMSDLFKTNQRIDELIDELVEQLEKLVFGSEAQQQSACLQVELLKQMKLLNIRTEEAFNTKINEGDIE